jgi:hypothetical protein
VIARRSILRKLLCVVVRVLPVLLLLAVLFAFVGCKKKKAAAGSPTASSTATTEGAALTTLDSGLTPVPMPKVTTAPPVASVAVAAPIPTDTMSPADRAAFEKMKAGLADLDAMMKRGVLTKPEHPDEGDAHMKCTALDSSRSRVETLADPEAKKMMTDFQRLCSYEVPLLNADHALKQLAVSGSQASHRLMCGMASQDLEKARAVKPHDRRVRELDGRLGRLCK